MAIVVPDLGKEQLLQWALREALDVDEGLILRLFKNDYTPANDSETADFTEADFGGYAEKPLARTGWNAPSTVSNQGFIEFGTLQTWTCTSGSNTVYGYYIVTENSNITVWAQRFGTPRTVDSGVELNIIPSLKDDTLD